MNKKIWALISFLLIATLMLGACAKATEVPPTEAPPAEVPPTEAPPAEVPPTEVMFKACQVTDTGGIDDKSFNATAWKGVTDAMEQLGIEGKYLESQQQTDYEKNINAFITEGCDLIVTVGFLLGDATKAAAEANPDTKFSIVDFAYDPTLANVSGQVFNTDEAAFLAGYVAAAVSKSGKVGTFGGIQIPPVTVFMDGFAMGVKYYNEQKGTAVEVLGWDPATQTGLFTGNFESTDDGRTMGQSLMDEGADVIMPVAGPVGLGTAAAALERGGTYIVGVDNDWFLSAPEYASIILTSVLKNMDITTFNTIKAVMDGTFEGGVVVGTLENGGVGLADFHDLASMVPDDVKTELDAVKAGVIDGSINIKPTPVEATPPPAATDPVATYKTAICDAGKEYSLTYWHQWSGTYYENIKAEFDKYMAENPCVKIDLSKPDDVTNALQSAMPAGQGPDILGWANDHIGDLSALGYLVPLNDYGIDMAYLEANFEPAAINGVVLNDVIYALPETQEGIALIYNKAVVTDEYLPTDPMDFEALFTKAEKFKTDKGFPLVCNQALGGNDAYHAGPVYFGFGVPQYVDADGKAYMNTPEGIAAATWIQKFAGVSNAEASYDICNANMQEGKVGMWWTGPWAMAGLIEKGIDFGILPMGKPFVGIKTHAITTNAVDRGNVDAALDVIKWFNSAGVQFNLAVINKTIPAQTAAVNAPTLAADPVLAAFGKALNLGVPMANHVYAGAQWVPVGDATLAVWQGKQTPEEAMAAAQTAIETAVAGMK
jgi:basic membrane lipoprotein Med (substrate-binding protein (PBP1-ABC) superfamily)/maltose-binding protein MalE